MDSLLNQVRILSRRSNRESVRKTCEESRKDEEIWNYHESEKATAIIKELPDKLKEEARRAYPAHYEPSRTHGPGKYRVLTLDFRHGDDGKLENLKGQPAYIRDWCRANGFGAVLVHQSDSNPGYEAGWYDLVITW